MRQDGLGLLQTLPVQTLRGYPWNHTRGFQQQKTQTIFGRLKRRFVLIRPRDDPQSNTTVDTESLRVI